MRPTRHPAAAAAAVLVAIAVPVAPAAGARPATPAERAEMVPSFGYQMVGERCAAATVSTVPGGERWARIDAVDPAPEGCRAARVQYLLLHRDLRTTDRPWSTAFYGNPRSRNPPRRCADLLVPDAVGRDLAVCAPSGSLSRGARSRTTMGCHDRRRGVRVTHERRPRRCVVTTSGGVLSSGFELRDVRWTGWGRDVARGRGLVRRYSSRGPEGRFERRSFTASTVVRWGGARSYEQFRVPGLGSSYDVVLPGTDGPRR